MGAGILPITICSDGKIYFYLEKKINTKIQHLDGQISVVEQTTKKPFFKQHVAKVQKN